jgi:hypothetical protein
VGTQIVRVPHGFAHPADDAGCPIPGAHLEPLYDAGPERCVCYQLYENVTDGTPISPAFEMLTELSDWLRRQGWPDEKISYLVENGHAPSFVARGGQVAW